VFHDETGEAGTGGNGREWTPGKRWGVEIVEPELLAHASSHVQTFCHHIQNILGHTTSTYCGKVCAGIIALNTMLQQDPLDAFVLLPQILCITKMAIATDIKGHTHNFANHTHATFRYNDKNGNQTDKNIMHVIHDMALFLTALCQPSVILAETHCNSLRHLLGELKALISTYDL